mmetsp:Transcript_31586/g.67782  ORF Transcript_31586/g.67782 Transcript_31586/m.67782 type:complete len:95 (-) Transcript_31586:337-621(-)
MDLNIRPFVLPTCDDVLEQTLSGRPGKVDTEQEIQQQQFDESSPENLPIHGLESTLVEPVQNLTKWVLGLSVILVTLISLSIIQEASDLSPEFQ